MTERVPPWLYETNWAVFDLETSGVDTATDQMIQCAVMHVDQGVPGLIWSKRFLPSVPIHEKATETHGWTLEKLKDAGAEPFSAADADTIRRIFRGRVLLAYNGAHFDLPILSRQMSAFVAPGGGGGPCDDYALVDPLVWVREHHRYVRGQGRHKLGATAERLGVRIDDELHDAVTDVRQTWRVWEALCKENDQAMPRVLGRLLAMQRSTARRQDEDFKQYLRRQQQKEAMTR